MQPALQPPCAPRPPLSPRATGAILDVLLLWWHNPPHVPRLHVQQPGPCHAPARTSGHGSDSGAHWPSPHQGSWGVPRPDSPRQASGWPTRHPAEGWGVTAPEGDRGRAPDCELGSPCTVSDPMPLKPHSAPPSRALPGGLYAQVPRSVPLEPGTLLPGQAWWPSGRVAARGLAPSLVNGAHSCHGPAPSPASPGKLAPLRLPAAAGLSGL